MDRINRFITRCVDAVLDDIFDEEKAVSIFRKQKEKK
jgi:hypothetical protein